MLIWPLRKSYEKKTGSVGNKNTTNDFGSGERYAKRRIRKNDRIETQSCKSSKVDTIKKKNFSGLARFWHSQNPSLCIVLEENPVEKRPFERPHIR